jgi:peptide/nickel transport system ATP-binding protein
MNLLDTVKLPRDFYFRKPRQLSGGQKQRIGIARAFAGNPSMVIADEPVSALDVSVAAAVTELLMEIQREHKTTLLFISHDLSVVRYLSDRIVVMYLGHILERGTTKKSFHRPTTPIPRRYYQPCRSPIRKFQSVRLYWKGTCPAR